jgi:hypothetical protein
MVLKRTCTKGEIEMKSKGYTQGDTILLTYPLPVPDGTEVTVVVSKRTGTKGKPGGKQTSVAEETFGLIPAEPALVHQVLEEDVYEA